MSPNRSYCGKHHGEGVDYKARYGGRGSSSKRSQHDCQNRYNNLEEAQSELDISFSNPQNKLEALLDSIDKRQYGFYKRLSGHRFVFEKFTLVFDNIQTDAYAPPSQIRLIISQKAARFPIDLYSTKVRNIACAHYLSQLIHECLKSIQSTHATKKSGGWSSTKGGAIGVDRPGQEVIERTSVVIDKDNIEARLTAALPASGRTIVAGLAKNMFLETLPLLVSRTLLYESVNAQTMKELVECVEDQEYLRSQLLSKGIIGFIGDGSILPRRNGISSLPLVAQNVVPFTSPASMRVSFVLPNRGEVTGMGIPQGITLISGGGFNGKSTLLQAIELGVYNHIPGDGRELVVTLLNATKIKSEEGRFISNTDIRPFINNLPFGRDTKQFATEDASGSTSMAASIQEALESGADALLYDEDTCATNFLVRDRRMQKLVSREHEPITPLVNRIREMWNVHKISSVLVIGGCGDYLDVADVVIDMYEYTASDATMRAKNIVEQMPINLEIPTSVYSYISKRALDIPVDLVSYKPPIVKTQWSIALFPSARLAKRSSASKCHLDIIDKEKYNGTGGKDGSADAELQPPTLDISALDQLVSASQTRTIALIINRIAQSTDHMKIKEWLSLVERMELDEICTGRNKSGNLARPRIIEIAMAINRLRYARMWQPKQ
ncbi:hypothetical protein IW140_003490 [Coemansia sp. RSA 1813]|nr:hypothetical protein EV178_003423 [Coemansia sp. RSA 1646]KAJ2093481.1 hypothetical protein IW138_000331 [Coemansia sp. RSA 986]KAJ2214300.1 hypothetical protein EV179_003079 [Coemansia sp. RSA 487]KAJ2568867.1 hypothetical protein IW140_003490 [Coemansia sp. RSA 1813]